MQLGLPWAGLDPFIFTVHYVDNCPAGKHQLGPAASLTGRYIGSDFSHIDGWSMCHGDVIAGSLGRFTAPSPPVHDRSDGRFAIHPDGRIEHRDMERIV